MRNGPRPNRLAPLAALAILAGCASTPPGPPRALHPYPRDLPQKAVLDIQVFRVGRHIEVTNTSTHAFGPGTVWVNGRYSRPSPGLAVGETVSWPLTEFLDEYHEPFRAGGFFAAEVPDLVVLCQIEEPGPAGEKASLWGLVVAGPLTDE